MRLRKLTLSLVLLIFSNFISGQSKDIRYGTPLYKSYSPNDYHGHSQLWASTQLDDGLMLLGSTSNAMLFDGIHWNNLNKVTFPRTFLNDTASKRIYFGGDSNFGYFTFDNLGKPKVTLFSDSLNGRDKDFYTILSIVKKNDKVYFVGLKRIFIYKDDNLISSIGSETDYRFAFTPEDKFFIRQSNVGLMEVKGDSLIKVPQSELFGNENIYFILPYDSTHYLLGSKNLGLFMFDKNYKNSQRVFTPFENELTSFFTEKKINTGILLSDGRIAIGTILGGIVIINHDLTPHLFFSEQEGLVNNGSHNIFQDRENNLWIMTDNGFSILFYGESINKMYRKITNGKFLTVTLDKYKDQLFMGTMGGITKIFLQDYSSAEQPQSFISIDRFNDLQTQVMYISHSNDNFIASTRDGVFSFKSNTYPKLIDSTQLSFCGMFSKSDSSFFFNGSLYGVDIFHNENGHWKHIGRIPFDNEIRQITEQQKGVIYASSQLAGIYKIDMPDYLNLEYNITHYDSSKGIPSGQGTINTCFWNNNVIALGGKKIYRLNTDKDIFEDVTQQICRFKDPLDTAALPISTTSDFLVPNNRYFSTNSNGNISEVFVTDSTFIISSYPFRNIINTGYFQIIDDKEEQCVWFTGPSGIYNYFYSTPNIRKNFSAYIYQVSIGSDSIISYNNNSALGEDLPYKFNSIRFDCSALYYENPEQTTYSYKLEGFDKNWSDYNKETFTKYTNLPPGTYTFNVKATNVYGIESLPATFTFTILPPWYRTWWAYLIYLVLIFIVVRFIIFLNIKRLKAINIKLEKIVDERTAEIKQKNLQLEEKNELITNSIYYAKKIQDAIIPSEHTLKKRFPDSFIYYLPRDIVSGDFFWMHVINNDETILALSDCTGHGVPGAFMSMIGNTLLNEIIKEKKINDPAEVLKKLHMGIVNALQTHNENEVTEDGMDIIICKINTKEKLITLAGANQNAFLFTDRNFIDFSSTILSIGDPFARKQEVNFENHEYSFTSSFQLFLSSDGYYDQFGSENNKKFTLTRFINLIEDVNGKSSVEKKEVFDKAFTDWKKDKQQIDDVLVIGVAYKISE